jgi:hypothetical protein
MSAGLLTDLQGNPATVQCTTRSKRTGHAAAKSQPNSWRPQSPALSLKHTFEMAIERLFCCPPVCSNSWDSFTDLKASRDAVELPTRASRPRQTIAVFIFMVPEVRKESSVRCNEQNELGDHHV